MPRPKGHRSTKPNAALKPRWVLAKTCTGCGRFRQGDDFRTSRSLQQSPHKASRCKDCERRYLAEHRKESGHDSEARYAREAQSESGVAPRKGQEWTGPEIEILSREDLTAKQIAQMTGRTYFAVVQARSILRKGIWEKGNIALGKMRS